MGEQPEGSCAEIRNQMWAEPLWLARLCPRQGRARPDRHRNGVITEVVPEAAVVTWPL